MMNNPGSNRFESALLELEAIVASLEAGKVPLVEALAAYQRGALLVRECQNTLTAAETRVQVLEQNLLREFDQPTTTNHGDE